MKYFVKYRISENISETPEGFLVCIGVPIARTGEMVYGPGETPISDTEKVTITRDAAEVFKPETMASFEGKAITIRHPEEFVSPDNWSELAKGTMQNVRRGKGDQENDLIADLLITDSMAIELVKNGLREVSCGYEADYVETGKNAGFQRDIIGNHLALVHQGRAGSGYQINDHKGDCDMKFLDRFRKKVEEKFPKKTADEILKVVDEEAKEESKESKDEMGYDELVKVMNELPDKLAAAMGKKEEGKDDARGERDVPNGEAAADEEEESKDEDGMEDRMKTCEAALEKILKHLNAKDEDWGGEGKDEDMEDEDEDAEDDDFEESTMVGDSVDEEDDTLSRAEILAPGIKKSKDLMKKALIAASRTEDGKKVIDTFTGGKKLTFDSAERTKAIFIGASELLKQSRTKDLEENRRTMRKKALDYVPSLDNKSAVSAEDLNKINEKFYASKQA